MPGSGPARARTPLCYGQIEVPAMAAPSAVEVSECAFRYGKTTALAGVSFAVPQGTIFGLLGPNGSGKTTLFRILATLLAPDSGHARVFGADVAGEPLEVRRRMGVVFQSQSLDRRLSVEENLTHQGHLYGLRGALLAERIGEALDKVGLGDRGKDRVETLSGGLRRRADLAKCLLHLPRLLLLDEPSTGVDPGARLAFWRCLEELRRSEGVTVLLTTHLLEEADRCDRLAILDRGRLVREGAPSELKAEIGGAVVRVSADDPAEVAAALETEFEVRDAQVDGREVRFEHPDGGQWAYRLAGRFEDRIDSVTVSKPSLEDVFLHHAGRRFDPEASPWSATQAPTS